MRKLVMDYTEDLEHATLVEDFTKLKLTHRQLVTLTNASLVLKFLSEDKRFVECIKTILGKEVKTSSIMSEFVKPIVQAPKRVQRRRVKHEGSHDMPKKETWFTKEVEATHQSKSLYNVVKNIEHLKLRFANQDISTCVIDIRAMLVAYMKQDVIDEGFLRTLAPDAMEKYKLGSRQFTMNAAGEISK